MTWEEYLGHLNAAGPEGQEILRRLVTMLNEDPEGFARLLAEMGVEPPNVMPRGPMPVPQFQLGNPPQVVLPDSGMPGGPPPLPGPGEFAPVPIPVGPAPAPVDPSLFPRGPAPPDILMAPPSESIFPTGPAPPDVLTAGLSPRGGEEPAATITPKAPSGPQQPPADAGNAVNWADFLSGVVAPEPPNVAIPSPPPPVVPRGAPTDNLAALFATLFGGSASGGRSPPLTLSEILRGIV